jgi:hypothetical protein
MKESELINLYKTNRNKYPNNRFACNLNAGIDLANYNSLSNYNMNDAIKLYDEIISDAINIIVG